MPGYRVLFALVLCAVATACSTGEVDPVEQAQADYQDRHDANVLDGQMRALERVRDVQGDVDENAARVRRLLEEAETGSPD